MSAAVIETAGLSKLYGRSHAVRNLNLSVTPGRITAFLGLNGAGKSTTIRMLLGMIRPTEGTGTVLGRSIDDPAQSVALRADVAYVSEDKRLYNYMTVEQMVRFTSGFFPGWREDLASALLRRYELPAKRKVRHLSKGMRTKLALLLAIARRPALLILDEPSEGLDPRGVEQLLEALVAQCAEGTSVFFSSHQIEEVERISDQICIIHQGRLAMDASLDELRTSWRRVDAVLPGGPQPHDFTMRGVERLRTRGQQMSVVASGNVDAIVARARESGASTIDVTPVGLREIFLQTIEPDSIAEN
ncbi:MAG TPA: ABC transporter ATP-binding protein [Bryobacteraceae bacterium]|nr:ABC transporter ATP-binding protein [Bryobacteraceae bacterium]